MIIAIVIVIVLGLELVLALSLTLVLVAVVVVVVIVVAVVAVVVAAVVVVDVAVADAAVVVLLVVVAAGVVVEAAVVAVMSLLPVFGRSRSSHDKPAVSSAGAGRRPHLRFCSGQGHECYMHAARRLNYNRRTNSGVATLNLQSSLWNLTYCKEVL